MGRWTALCKVTIGLILIMGIQCVGLAQSPLISDGVLVYVRHPGSSAEYVILSDTTRQVYTLPTDKCTALSADGIYIGQSSMDRDDLVIRRLDTLELVAQVPWDAQWQPCTIGISTGGRLSIHQVDDPTIRFYFDIDTASVSLLPIDPPALNSPRSLPELPDYLPDTRTNFVLPSPEEGVFLYERCTGGNISDSGEVCLMGSDDFVIYDALQKTVIHVLQNPDGREIRGYEAYYARFGSHLNPGAAWSHTGRYLAFIENLDHGFDFFNLSVYDRVADRYLDTEWINVEIDYYKAMQWSPQADKLLFWIIGQLDVEPEFSNNDWRSLVIFDASTETFSWADQSFNGGSQGIWSPDGLGYLFTDFDDTLYYVNIHTGVSTVLDDHVSWIVAWRTDVEPPK